MVELYFSFVIPVYNRPQEIMELLESLSQVSESFEVVIVEDGSQDTCKKAVEGSKEKLDISYYFKSNTGPGDSRNYGMKRAKGNYFIILDSDVIVPANYLEVVRKALTESYMDCYGGGDTALDSFTPVQKSIDYAMTSLLTTGGIRGSAQSKSSNSYEPRSFNMGISRAAFLESKGFSSIHPGEDPDLSIRLKKLGFKVGYIDKAQVYHKRRTDFKKFAQQVFKFGLVRPILLVRYPETSKITYWFPFFYTLMLLLGLILLLFKLHFLLYFYALYNFLMFIDALFSHKHFKIAILSVLAANIQFVSYGVGFVWSYFKIHILRQIPENAFPKLFFSQ
ncbi:glycosyltransferase [Psychroflexus sediminis]|uniref:Glycosyltransferase, catalytic subunit of cellulose synthase and poly-beta-1,6-N-acetylglucosamine synthase n=1 Tax=Psychroflexus sediminis TaxID=470826 RepID=A0A1G7VPU7_9FLAO|nr:glycosyltransferase [Psychroflexus sediminis]SDG61832.1 Glycosyltransferase, catalytic subunit of cellulose synthase and poly-beta-1,6-N-acetylglucosamine synthase [Psychroflexus sediminis]